MLLRTFNHLGFRMSVPSWLFVINVETLTVMPKPMSLMFSIRSVIRMEYDLNKVLF